jgi:hypothetical protein
VEEHERADIETTFKQSELADRSTEKDIAPPLVAKHFLAESNGNTQSAET